MVLNRGFFKELNLKRARIHRGTALENSVPQPRYMLAEEPLRSCVDEEVRISKGPRAK